MARDSYTDDEMALIVRRAAVLQAADEGGRHTLREIQDIAAQVGIPSELVAQVAADLPQQAPPGSISRALLGPAASCAASGTLARPLSPTAYPELVAAIRRAAGKMGRATEIGRSLEWRTGSAYYELTLTVVPRERDTSVRVEGNYEGWKKLPYYVAVLAAGYIGLVVSETQGPAVVGAAVIGALVGGVGSGSLAVGRPFAQGGAAGGVAPRCRTRALARSSGDRHTARVCRRWLSRRAVDPTGLGASQPARLPRSPCPIVRLRNALVGKERSK